MQTGKPGNSKTRQRATKGLSPAVRVMLILFTAALAYFPSLACDFINLDDYYYVTKVRPFSAAKIAEAFRSTYEGYHPLTLVSLGLDRHFSGFNPWVFHGHNLVLHLLNSALVYLLVVRLFRSVAASLAACLVFALHPVHVEAVVWVTSRKDVLYSLFYLAGLVAYMRHGGNGTSRLGLMGAWTCFILACFAKGMAASFPLSLLCIDFLQGRRLLSRRVVLEKVPFLAVAAVFGLVSVLGQHASGYMADIGEMRPLMLRLGLAVYALWLYAWNLLWPFDLAAFYPYPDTLAGWPPASFYLALALAVPALAVTWHLTRRYRRAAFCLLFFAANLVLVLQIVPVANFIVANRYNYLSSVGFCALIGLGTARLYAGSGSLRRLVTGAMALYALTLGLTTHGLCKTWEDSVTLWSDVIHKQPEAVFALNMRGCAFNDLRAYDRAVADFDRAIALRPGFSRSYLNRGFTRYKQGDLQGAISDYNATLVLSPESVLARNNRGLALHAQGAYSQAVADFDAAIDQGAETLQAYLLYNNRSMTRLALEDYAGALADAERALALKPNYALALMHRARALSGLGQKKDAVEGFNDALRLDPANWEAWLQKAQLEIDLGQLADARLSVSNAIVAGGEAARAGANRLPGFAP